MLGIIVQHLIKVKHAGYYGAAFAGLSHIGWLSCSGFSIGICTVLAKVYCQVPEVSLIYYDVTHSVYLYRLCTILVSCLFPDS